MAFSLTVASRKLHPYIQAHTIMVMTNQLIWKAMSKPDVVGCMVQWAVELSQFDIMYKPKAAIKAEVQANFIAKFTIPNSDQEAEYWTIFTDGSSIIGLRGVGIIVTMFEKDTLRYRVQFQFLATKNEAEYEAVLASLRIAKAMGVRNLKLKADSKLVVGQITN